MWVNGDECVEDEKGIKYEEEVDGQHLSSTEK